MLDGSKSVTDLATKPEAFATAVSSFAFTMMGLLAALLSLLSVFSGSAAAKAYRESGALKNFHVVLVATLVALALTFAFAMSTFFGATVASIRLLTAFTVMSGVMSVLSMMPIIGLYLRSQND